MPELLLELFSEEIPARMQARAAEDLKRLVCDRLKEQGLEFSRADAFATPRRLALVVDGLPAKQPDQTIEKKGPRVGAPEKAIEGFLKSAGLTSLDQCEKRDDGKSEVWFAVDRAAGLPTNRALASILSDVIERLPWPKSMRWAYGNATWVRPLRSILAILDGQEIIFEFELVRTVEAISAGRPEDHITTGTATRGHRFLAPGLISVTSFEDYRTKLLGAKVILDPAERRASILDQAHRLTKEAGLTLVEDAALADEVTGLVEWPKVYPGKIEERFMALPPEVLTTTMRTNQKYFALNTKDGKLAPHFLVVSNMETADGGKAIVAGNERVLRARLSDAEFFWNQDRKTRLEDRVPALEQIVFHAKLGTVADKMRRVQALAAGIAQFVPGADPTKAQRAAKLAKADLTTGMVKEFPELQGTMGRYYALNDGEDASVADAIAEHYGPQGPNDICPTAPISVVVALVDKIDTIVGLFTIGEKPTGSKDPFALRRSALGAIRLIVENRLRVKLVGLILSVYLNTLSRYLHNKKLVGVHKETGANVIYTREEFEERIKKDGPAAAFGDLEEFATSHTPHALDVAMDYLPDGHGSIVMTDAAFKGDAAALPDTASIVKLVLEFFADRLKVALREKGVRHDLISAVFALGDEDDLVRLLARVEALQKFLESEDGANLLVAYRRAANIVRIEEKKDKASFDAAVEPAKLIEAEEKALHVALGAVEGKVAAAIKSEGFGAAMTAMANLRRPVDAFFDKVTVNADDAGLRENRLRLLAQIRATLDRVADFSRIEG